MAAIETVVFLKIAVVFLILVAIILAGLCCLYFKNQLSGFSPWSKKDANPTQEDVARWTVSNFNPQGWHIWNLNPKLNGRPFDTGELFNQRTRIAPWGKNNWGFQAYEWAADCEGKSYEGPVEFSRLRGKAGRLDVWIKNSKDEFGNASVVQGWNWGSGEAIPWYCPDPLIIGSKKLVLSIDIKIDEAQVAGFLRFNKWLMIGETFWFRSADLPKPLVIDLVFYLQSGLPFFGDVMYSCESCDAYHYQKVVVKDKKEAIGQWRHYDLDLNWFIDEALQRFNISYAKNTLTLRSMEILIESKQAEAAFSVSNFALYFTGN